MQDPQLIWEFGRWIARRDPGTARLAWTGGEVVLGVREGRIHSALGLDPGELADRLACETTGETDLLAEARMLASTYDVAETRTMGTVKTRTNPAPRRTRLDSEMARCKASLGILCRKKVSTTTNTRMKPGR